MKSEELHGMITGKLHDKLVRLGMTSHELKKKTDLVRSGLVNSMEFVELVAGLEKELGVEIDYETELEKEGFTTLGGLQSVFQKYLDAKN